MIDLEKALTVAGVPEMYRQEAMGVLALAKAQSKGLLRHKLKVRLLKASKIAKLIPWDAERLLDVRPDLADWDIAPMINISAQGDNGDWAGPAETGIPLARMWMDPNPESEDYKRAVAACYWCKGEHPRSEKARKAWYRRNGGEFYAYRKGMSVREDDVPVVWTGEDDKLWVKACRTPSGVWVVVAQRRLLGSWGLKYRAGFEIDNVFGGQYAPRLWYPIPGYQLAAPVTWSTVPGKLEEKR